MHDNNIKTRKQDVRWTWKMTGENLHGILNCIDGWRSHRAGSDHDGHGDAGRGEMHGSEVRWSNTGGGYYGILKFGGETSSWGVDFVGGYPRERERKGKVKTTSAVGEIEGRVERSRGRREKLRRKGIFSEPSPRTQWRSSTGVNEPAALSSSLFRSHRLARTRSLDARAMKI